MKLRPILLASCSVHNLFYCCGSFLKFDKGILKGLLLCGFSSTSSFENILLALILSIYPHSCWLSMAVYHSLSSNYHWIFFWVWKLIWMFSFPNAIIWPIISSLDVICFYDICQEKLCNYGNHCMQYAYFSALTMRKDSILQPVMTCCSMDVNIR